MQRKSTPFSQIVKVFGFSVGVAFVVGIGTLSLAPQTAEAIELPDVTIPGVTGPSNFWECILDKMPGVGYGVEYNKQLRNCKKEFPKNERIEKDTGGLMRIFETPKAKECFKEKSKGTPSRKAKIAIRQACYALYPTQTESSVEAK